MGGLPAPAWYSEHVLAHAEPGPLLWPDKGPARQWRQWWSWQATGDDPAQRLARTQGFVVTTGQLRNLGWRRHDDRRERRRGTWTPVGSSCRSPVRAASDAADRFVVRRREHALSAAAAALVRRDHAVTGRSAAVLHGLPTLRLPEQPELTASAVALGRRGRAHVFGARLPAEDVTQWFGTPVSTVARTVVDMARHDRRDGLVVAGAAMHEKLVTREQLRAVLRGAAGWPGVRQARAIVDLADARAESPLESLLRLALHDDGFPAPDLQVVIHDPCGAGPTGSTCSSRTRA
jgi:hypothetical protein